jgi:hypothetical protein
MIYNLEPMDYAQGTTQEKKAGLNIKSDLDDWVTGPRQ